MRGALALLLLLLAPLARAEDRPNVILVFVDDLGWADFSCFGNGDTETPCVDRLAAEGFGHQPPVAYRALAFLTEHGLAHRIRRLNAFAACDRTASSAYRKLAHEYRVASKDLVSLGLDAQFDFSLYWAILGTLARSVCPR